MSFADMRAARRMQVEGSLEVAADLSDAVLAVGKLIIGPHGAFTAGTSEAPHDGGFTVQLNTTLVDTREQPDSQPSIDVFGSLSLVGEAKTQGEAAMPVGTNVRLQSATKLVAAEGAGLTGLQAGGIVGVRSGAGHELGEVTAVAEGVITLAGGLAMQHTGNVRLHALSRGVRIVSEGAPGVLRVWNGEPHVTGEAGRQRRRLQRVAPGARALASAEANTGSVLGRTLLHGHEAVAAEAPTAAAKHSCAGSACSGGFVSSLAARGAPEGVVRLHGVEVAGLGGAGGAAIEVEDPACQHRWPAQPKTVDISGSSLRGLQGSGVRLQGCVAHMQVRGMLDSILSHSHLCLLKWPSLHVTGCATYHSASHLVLRCAVNMWLANT